MAPPLALESRPLVLELHALLSELDPARWRDELAEQLGSRLERLADALHELADRFEDDEEISVPGAAAAGLWLRLGALADDLDELIPAPLESAEERQRAWLDVRDALLPRYEQLVVALRAEQVRLPSLRPTNYTRNLFHVGGALAAFFAIELLPLSWLFPVAASVAVAGWSMEGARRLSPAVNRALMWLFSPVAHASEEHGINSSTWYASALALIALTGEQAACAVAVLVLGAADPVASIVGRRFGSIKLVNGRSLQGSLAFLVVALAAALAVLVGWHPELPAPALVALAAALPATVAELVSRRLDDNFTVPLSAALGAWGALVLVG